MRQVDLTKKTRYNSSLEEKVVRFVTVMAEHGVIANGVLIETQFPAEEGPGLCHFGQLNQENLVEFWLRVVKMLAEFPAIERMRIETKDGRVN